MGRPPTAAVTFKDGFYIEVRSKGGTSSGVKIHSDGSEAMQAIATEYRKHKDVTILGEVKDGVWLTRQPGSTYNASGKGRRNK